MLTSNQNIKKGGEIIIFQGIAYDHGYCVDLIKALQIIQKRIFFFCFFYPVEITFSNLFIYLLYYQLK